MIRTLTYLMVGLLMISTSVLASVVVVQHMTPPPPKFVSVDAKRMVLELVQTLDKDMDDAAFRSVLTQYYDVLETVLKREMQGNLVVLHRDLVLTGAEDVTELVMSKMKEAREFTQ